MLEPGAVDSLGGNFSVLHIHPPTSTAFDASQGPFRLAGNTYTYVHFSESTRSGTGIQGGKTGHGEAGCWRMVATRLGWIDEYTVPAKRRGRYRILAPAEALKYWSQGPGDGRSYCAGQASRRAMPIRCQYGPTMQWSHSLHPPRKVAVIRAKRRNARAPSGAGRAVRPVEQATAGLQRTVQGLENGLADP